MRAQARPQHRAGGVMRGSDIVTAPSVLERLKRNGATSRRSLVKLSELLKRRARALELYEAFGARDAVAPDLYPQAPKRDEYK